MIEVILYLIVFIVTLLGGISGFCTGQIAVGVTLSVCSLVSLFVVISYICNYVYELKHPKPLESGTLNLEI